MKYCYKCKLKIPVSNFHKAKNRSDGYNSRCKDCQRVYNKSRYEKDPESFKLKRILSRYGIGKDQYYKMIENGCEVCGSFEILHIDHDHSCCGYAEGSRDVITCGKCIRGVLCKNCNTAEGLLKSNPKTAERLAIYMRGRS